MSKQQPICRTDNCYGAPKYILIQHNCIEYEMFQCRKCMEGRYLANYSKLKYMTSREKNARGWRYYIGWKPANEGEEVKGFDIHTIVCKYGVPKQKDVTGSMMINVRKNIK